MVQSWPLEGEGCSTLASEWSQVEAGWHGGGFQELASRSSSLERQDIASRQHVS